MQKKAPSAKKQEKPAPKIDVNAEATKELANAIKELSATKADALDLSPLINALTTVQESQSKLIENMQTTRTKKETWEFAFKRKNKGEIEKIFAKETSNV